MFIELAPGQGDINVQKLDFTDIACDGMGGIACRGFGDWIFASSPDFTTDLDASGDVFMNSDLPIDYGTLLHEIGHSPGLKRPDEVWTDIAANPPVVHNVWSTDDPLLTIMSQLPGGTAHLIAIAPIATLVGDQAFSFVGTAAFTTDFRDQVRYQVEFGTTARVQIDRNLDAIADLSFILYTVSSRTAADFTR